MSRRQASALRMSAEMRAVFACGSKRLKEKEREKKMKKLRNYFAMGLLLITVALCGINAGAAEDPVCADAVTLKYVENPIGCQLSGSFIYLKNVDAGASLVSIKSSNKKIEAVWNPGMDQIMLYVKPRTATGRYMYTLKNGEKTKITLKIKQNGKVYTLQCQVTLKKMTNPVKSIKISGKTYKTFKKAASGWSVSTGKKMPSSVKINVTPKDGCKIMELYVGYHKPGWRKEETKKIKNGSKVSTSYSGGTLTAVYVQYYEDEDLQGMVTPKELKKSFGGNSAYITLKFK